MLHKKETVTIGYKALACIGNEEPINGTSSVSHSLKVARFEKDAVPCCWWYLPAQYHVQSSFIMRTFSIGPFGIVKQQILYMMHFTCPPIT